MQREEVYFQTVLLRGQRKILVGLLWRQLSEILPLFPPPLPEAGRRRGLPGSAARARAGKQGLRSAARPAAGRARPRLG